MSKFKGFATRATTGLIAAIVALGLTIAHPYSFAALLVIACVIGIREWEGLNIKKTMQFRLCGLLYLIASIACLAWLRMVPINTGDKMLSGPYWVLALFALVWTTDIAAYLSGRLIGGAKIAPSISPNKTWAGLIGAVVATAALASYLSTYLPSLRLADGMIIGAATAIIAQAGDFLESSLKRRAGVKDSGKLLPGHGGLLDRIDGLLAASILFAFWVYIYVPI